MTAESDDLAQALRHHEDLTGEYVQVEQGIAAGLSRPVRRHRWLPILAVLVVLIAAAPAAMFTGRSHFTPKWFPSAATTGVPAGVSLTSYTGPCQITTPNTVIDSKIVTCQPLEIRAANVQVSRSQTEQIWLDTDLNGAAPWSVSITDSEITVARVINLAAVCCGDYTISRTEIQGADYSAQCEMGTTFGINGVNCTIQDSYLHGQNTDPAQDWHSGGFISEGGPNVVNLTHNYIVCDVPTNPADGGCTGDMNLLAHFGQMQDVTIRNNFFGTTASTPRGSGPTAEYCVYGGPVAENPTTTRVRFIDNVFEKGISGVCGNSGPVGEWDATGVGNEWTNNLYNDGTPVPPN